MNTFKQVKQSIVDTAKDAGETIVDAAKNARDAVVDAKDAVFDAVVDAKDKTLDAAQEAKDKVVKLADTMTCAMIGSKEDILEILKSDHELVAAYFDQLEATSSAAFTLREGLFGQLKYELETHSAAEENLFYPALRKRAGTGALLTEAHTDHDLVKQLLVDLAAQPMNSEGWLAQLRVLKENVERHVQMEEDELFVWAKKYMTGAQRDELGLRFLAEKQRLDGNGKSRAQKSARKPVAKKASRGHHHASV